MSKIFNLKCSVKVPSLLHTRAFLTDAFFLQGFFGQRLRNHPGQESRIAPKKFKPQEPDTFQEIKIWIDSVSEMRKYGKYHWWSVTDYYSRQIKCCEWGWEFVQCCTVNNCTILYVSAIVGYWRNCPFWLRQAASLSTFKKTQGKNSRTMNFSLYFGYIWFLLAKLNDFCSKKRIF